MCMFLDCGRKWQCSFCLMLFTFYRSLSLVVGCFRPRPRHLASISNLLAIRALSSGEVFWKLSVDDLKTECRWLTGKRERKRTGPIKDVTNPNPAWIYYESTEGVVLLLRLQLHCVEFLCHIFPRRQEKLAITLKVKHIAGIQTSGRLKHFFLGERGDWLWSLVSTEWSSVLLTSNIPLCFPLQNAMDIFPHHHSVTLSQRSGGECWAALFQDGLFGCFRQLGK